MFELKKKKKIVFVGLSGGVDSSVSVALLKKRGCEVVGVFIRTWQPDWLPCTWREDRRSAMQVAAALDIPFLECNLANEYKKDVVDYMINEYGQGRTPNPDVMCNKQIKFGGFLKWALERGAEFIATGHYALSEKGLFRGKDENKDQSYFLWTLTRDQLSKTIFPVGRYQKREVRMMAERFGLPTSSRPDSQGICFLGEVDMKEFLQRYLETKSGDVLNEGGEKIGHHQGAVLYTLGERHGFTITKKTPSDKPLFVVEKNLEQNTITVSIEKTTPSVGLSGLTIELKEVNDIWGELEIGRIFDCQLRYHGRVYECKLLDYEPKKKTARVELVQQEAVLVVPGQSLVFYEKDKCLGGGVIV